MGNLCAVWSESHKLSFAISSTDRCFCYSEQKHKFASESKKNSHHFVCRALGSLKNIVKVASRRSYDVYDHLTK